MNFLILLMKLLLDIMADQKSTATRNPKTIPGDTRDDSSEISLGDQFMAVEVSEYMIAWKYSVESNFIIHSQTNLF